MSQTHDSLNLGERVAIAFCERHGLRAERFTKAERRAGKTPDFRVYKDEQLVYFCEAKHVQHDDWLDKQLEQAQPLEIVGGLRHDPVFNRLAEHIHKAAQQFDAVNHDRRCPNVLVFTNSDRRSGFADLVSTLTGNFYAEDGSVDAIYQNVSEGRIREEKFTIDLYVWVDEWGPEKKRMFFNESSPHYAALSRILGSDSSKHRHV